MKNNLIVKLRVVASLLTILFFDTSVGARHIIGGEMTYRCLGSIGNIVIYDVSSHLYSDAVGGEALFDTNADFGLYLRSAFFWQHVSTQNISIESISSILEIPSRGLVHKFIAW